MGSRAFYEGWDSNRPNVMIFINIGKGEAKKYVTQSIGRGIRIEPIQTKRKRLSSLKKENNIMAKELYSKSNKKDISLIETLFILGTNKKNVEEILNNIKHERKSSGEILELKKNKEIKNKELLIPVYKKREEEITIDELPKFEGNKKLLEKFFEWLGDEKLIYALFSNEDYVNPHTIEKSKEFLKNGRFLQFHGTDVYSRTIGLMKHVNIKLRDLDRFKKVNNEIVHFRRIRIMLEGEELRRLKELIGKVKNYGESSEKEKELKRSFENEKIGLEEYTSKTKELENVSKEEKFRDLKIKHLLNHYYVPVVISESDKINYINHIINVESEKKFIEHLEKSIQKEKQSVKAI